MAGRRVRGADRPVTTPWNMASFRARSYSPRKYKPVGPIGEQACNTAVATDEVCVCGYIMCSCEAELGEQFKPIEPRPGTLTREKVAELFARVADNGLGEGAQLFNVPIASRVVPNSELQLTAYDRQLAAESQRSQQIVRAGGRAGSHEKMIAELVTEWIENEEVPWSESGKRILDAWSCGCVITLIGRVKPERLAAAVKWRLSRGPLLTPTTFIESVKWAEREATLARSTHDS